MQGMCGFIAFFSKDLQDIRKFSPQSSLLNSLGTTLYHQSLLCTRIRNLPVVHSGITSGSLHTRRRKKNVIMQKFDTHGEQHGSSFAEQQEERRVLYRR